MIIEMQMWQFLAVIVLIVVAAVISAWDDVRKNRIINAQRQVIFDQRHKLAKYYLEEKLAQKEAEDGAAR